MSNYIKDTILLPRPKLYKAREGYFSFGDAVMIAADSECVPVKALQCSIGKYVGKISKVQNSPQGDVRFVSRSGLAAEAYELDIDIAEISIYYSQNEGAFRAVTTLKQLMAQHKNQIPCCHISDSPDFKARGLMLDISRGKVPNLSTIKQIVDLMADMKYNQLQLYLEDFSFEYDAFPRYCEHTQPLTKDEVLELDTYCSRQYIELVPNQNSFGHMNHWLKQKDLNHLAITHDEGKEPFTLNPLQKETVELMDKLYGSLLPCFKSDMFNIGCDEAVELGMGETQAECDEKGKGEVFLAYLTQLHDLVKNKYHHNVMFWDDMIINHREYIEKIPKDVTVLEWGYDIAHNFERNCRLLRDTGLDFYVCPGTSAWNSFTGRSDVMFYNIKNAAEAGKYYGAKGFLLTDWGDNGHPQFLPVSYLGYACGAAFAWNSGGDALEWELKADVLELAKGYLDKFVFKTASGYSFADLLFRLGDYYLLESERMHNQTRTFMVFDKGFGDVSVFHQDDEKYFEAVTRYVRPLLKEVQQCRLGCKDRETIISEITLNAKMVLLFSEVGKLLIRNRTEKNYKKVKVLALELAEELLALKKEFLRSWCHRNHTYGSHIFMEKLENIAVKLKNL